MTITERVMVAEAITAIICFTAIGFLIGCGL